MRNINRYSVEKKGESFLTPLLVASVKAFRTYSASSNVGHANRRLYRFCNR